MMRKVSSLILALLLLFSMSAAMAAEKYENIFELYQQWDVSGIPDWVSSVSSTDGSAERLTVTLTEGFEDKEAELRAMLSDDSTLTVVTGGVYSDAELNEVYSEIVSEYMGADSPVAGCGVGWTTVDGKVTGFGKSGTESRVVVDVLAEYYDEIKAELEGKYGDMVYVESVSGYATAEAETGHSIFLSDDGSPVWVLMLMGALGVTAIGLAMRRIIKTVQKKRG